MEAALQRGVQWRELFARPGFPWLFLATFASLFGTGMHYAGVTWWVQEQTHSNVQVSLIVILVTVPGLFVPPFGGVLIDRVDRRYLGMVLDLTRALVVVVPAVLGLLGQLQLWHVFVMLALLGVGFSIFWSTMNALVQELMHAPEDPDHGHRHLVGANSAMLIAIQGGMATAGALVGFVYDHLGIGAILGIDSVTYLVSALCWWRIRRGYHAPHGHPDQPPPTIEVPASQEEEDEPVLAPIIEPGIVSGFLADLRRGLAYLRIQPRVMAIGLTHACMMAGVVSSNVVIVALAHDLLRAGPKGFGYIESGWAVGAVLGGYATGLVTRNLRPGVLLPMSLFILAVGHLLFPYMKFLWVVVAVQVLMGTCRALGGVVTQSAMMTSVPRGLMGRVQSAFSVISTLIQVVMSFSLGWVAEHLNLRVAFAIHAAIYGLAAFLALRARRL